MKPQLFDTTDFKTVRTFEEITALPLKTKLYLPLADRVEWVTYIGINPMTFNSVITASPGNVQSLSGMWLGNDKNLKTWYLDYSEACKVLYNNAIKNVQQVINNHASLSILLN